MAYKKSTGAITNNIKGDISSFWLLILGLISSFLFSATFLVNKSISIDGGHWFYSAFLRYVFTILFLSMLLMSFKGISYIKELFYEYLNHIKFWTISGTSGFGIFYALICFSADNSPAWILVSTWQFTIFASLIVLSFFGKKLKKSTIFFTILVVLGISMVNLSYFDMGDVSSFFTASFPVIIAAFAFPYGNQLIWEEQKKRDSKLLKNPFSKILLLVIGSSPLWFILFIFLDVGYPTISQSINVAIVTVISGILATSLFLYARNHANTSSKIMIVDATISGEVIFTLLCELIFLNGVFPTIWGVLGICITIISLVLMLLFEKKVKTK